MPRGSDKNMNKKIQCVVFDADGVLIDNHIGGFKDILVLFGKEKEVQRIDAEYQKRKHLGPWGLEELASLYKDFSRDILLRTASRYCLAHLMVGAKETVGALKEKKIKVGVISSNPRFLMEILADILFLDFFDGNELEFQNNIATGKIIKKVDRNTKAEILKIRMKKYHITQKHVAVVGDSITDLPMAECAELFIAFNAKPEVKERADVIIKKKDLREILPYLI